MKFWFIFAAALGFFLLEEAEARPKSINGYPADDNELKYSVAIQLIVNESENPKHICSGAIIDSHYVITAAHCVYGLDINQLLVRSGQKNEETGIDTTTYHNVMKYMYPVDYTNSSCRYHENDIAMLKMSRKFDLADDQKYTKVYLPTHDVDYEDKPVRFSGYGAERVQILVNEKTDNSTFDFKYPDKLKNFESTILALDVCKTIMPVTVTEAHICTDPNKATGFSCSGDGGGPLVYKNTIVGIRNKHTECIDSTPGLYSRVSYYLPFIVNILSHRYSRDVTYVSLNDE